MSRDIGRWLASRTRSHSCERPTLRLQSSTAGWLPASGTHLLLPPPRRSNFWQARGHYPARPACHYTGMTPTCQSDNELGLRDSSSDLHLRVLEGRLWCRFASVDIQNSRKPLLSFTPCSGVGMFGGCGSSDSSVSSVFLTSLPVVSHAECTPGRGEAWDFRSSRERAQPTCDSLVERRPTCTGLRPNALLTRRFTCGISY